MPFCASSGGASSATTCCITTRTWGQPTCGRSSDWANNSAGWQWSAGCGTDAAPYFRIFNPVAQSRRFDADGRYLRTWLPELRRLPDELIHAPREAPRPALAEAGVQLGEDYPYPIVDHAEARGRALEIYQTRIRNRSSKDGKRGN